MKLSIGRDVARGGMGMSVGDGYLIAGRLRVGRVRRWMVIVGGRRGGLMLKGAWRRGVGAGGRRGGNKGMRVLLLGRNTIST